MTWFKVDDTFYGHPKLTELEQGSCYFEAISLWVLAGSWSAAQLTDGAIPAGQIRKLGCKKRAAEELVRVGLWERTSTGYAYHDWAKYQPTREEIEVRRRATAERVRRSRNAARNAVTDGVTDAATSGVRNGGSNASPVPSRPVLDPPKPPRGVGSDRSESADSVPAETLLAALAAEASRRSCQPVPSVTPRDAARAAERAAELVRDGLFAEPERAAEALVRAAFDLALGPQQRPLRFALLEATVSKPNGRSRAQAEHVPPEDPWV